MSDDKKAGGPPDDSGGASDDSKDLKDTVSHDSYKKVLDEKKRLAKEHADLKSKFDEIEQKRLEEAGNDKALITEMKRKNKELEDKFKGSIRNFTEKTVKQSFNREAEKMGCIDSDLAFKACDLSDLDVGDDFELDAGKVKTMLQNLQKSKPHLFKKDASAPRDTNPGKSIDGKNLDQMTTEELWAEFKKS